ncbi:Enkurin domain-containing protein 1 [Geranomyces michiganensis]|nr:Enkurin domain-containing protein 1 [Geranomyces michiganensis]
MAGTAVAMLLKPSRGVRDDIAWSGGKPKDHRKENRLKLKQLEKANQAKKQELQKPPPPPFKLKQFEAVPAKLQTRRSDSRPSTASSRNSSTTPKNFININAAQARRPPPTPPSPEPPKGGERTTRKGEIPQYLINRKMEWARKEIERLQLIEDNNLCAKGSLIVLFHHSFHMLLGQDELMAALASFPVIIETMSMKKRKAVIEASLRELEDAEELFSRKKVYVTKENVSPPPPAPPALGGGPALLSVVDDGGDGGDERRAKRRLGGGGRPAATTPPPPPPPAPSSSSLSSTIPAAVPAPVLLFSSQTRGTPPPPPPAMPLPLPRARGAGGGGEGRDTPVFPAPLPLPRAGSGQGAERGRADTSRCERGGTLTPHNDLEEAEEPLIPRAAEDPKGETATTATGVAVWDRARTEAERISRASGGGGVAVR